MQIVLAHIPNNAMVDLPKQDICHHLGLRIACSTGLCSCEVAVR